MRDVLPRLDSARPSLLSLLCYSPLSDSDIFTARGIVGAIMSSTKLAPTLSLLYSPLNDSDIYTIYSSSSCRDSRGFCVCQRSLFLAAGS